MIPVSLIEALLERSGMGEFQKGLCTVKFDQMVICCKPGIASTFTLKLLYDGVVVSVHEFTLMDLDDTFVLSNLSGSLPINLKAEGTQ